MLSKCLGRVRFGMFISTRYTPIGMSRVGAKAFDVEVDVVSSTTADNVDTINELARLELQVQERLAGLLVQSQYVAKHLRQHLQSGESWRHVAEWIALPKEQRNESDLAYRKHDVTSSELDDASASQAMLRIAGMPAETMAVTDPAWAIQSRPVSTVDTVSEGRRQLKLQVDRERAYFLHRSTTEEAIRPSAETAVSIEAEAKTNEGDVATDLTSKPAARSLQQPTLSKPNPLLWSAIHTCRGFLDVADDQLFRSVSLNK